MSSACGSPDQSAVPTTRVGGRTGWRRFALIRRGPTDWPPRSARRLAGCGRGDVPVRRSQRRHRRGERFENWHRAVEPARAHVGDRGSKPAVHRSRRVIALQRVASAAIARRRCSMRVAPVAHDLCPVADHFERSVTELHRQRYAVAHRQKRREEPGVRREAGVVAPQRGGVLGSRWVATRNPPPPRRSTARCRWPARRPAAAARPAGRASARTAACRCPGTPGRRARQPCGGIGSRRRRSPRCAPARPARSMFDRATAARSASLSSVMSMPSAGSACAIQMAEYPMHVPISRTRLAPVAMTSERSRRAEAGCTSGRLLSPSFRLDRAQHGITACVAARRDTLQPASWTIWPMANPIVS